MLPKFILALAAAAPVAVLAHKDEPSRTEEPECTATVCLEYYNECGMPYGGCVPDCGGPEPCFTPPPCPGDEDYDECEDDDDDDGLDCDIEEDCEDDEGEGEEETSTTLTKTTTMIYTITACPETVHDCPVGHVKTETLTTTYCPGEKWTSTEVETTTVTSCPGVPEGECHVGDVTTCTKTYTGYVEPVWTPPAGGCTGAGCGGYGGGNGTYGHPTGGCYGPSCGGIATSTVKPTGAPTTPTPTATFVVGGVGRMEVNAAALGVAGFLVALL